jgi:hypothetical protein
VLEKIANPEEFDSMAVFDTQNLPGALPCLMCVAFLYGLLDVLFMEEDDCMVAMQQWLLVSYMSVAVFRGTQKIGQQCSQAGENFIFSFRQKSSAARLVVVFTWCILLPFFVVWTVLGSIWLRSIDTSAPHCETQSVNTHPQLILFWQVLSYVWVTIYLVYFGIACMIEFRLRVQERNLRLVQGEDSLNRWGEISRDEDEAVALKPQAGMNPFKIQALPTRILGVDDPVVNCEQHCPICICDFFEGETVRQLPSCNHCFHQSCIDLWLLRRADCPMCKSSVAGID